MTSFFEATQLYLKGAGVPSAVAPICFHLTGGSLETVAPAVMLKRVREALTSFRFSFVDERELQDGIEKVLANSVGGYKREASLGPADRPDFLLHDGAAIEVKVDGSLAELLRQVSRYASHDSVRAILVVGTPYWIAKLPSEIAGKPLAGLRLVTSLL